MKNSNSYSFDDSRILGAGILFFVVLFFLQYKNGIFFIKKEKPTANQVILSEILEMDKILSEKTQRVDSYQVQLFLYKDDNDKINKERKSRAEALLVKLEPELDSLARLTLDMLDSIPDSTISTFENLELSLLSISRTSAESAIIQARNPYK